MKNKVYMLNSIILCSVCQTENDKYATICKKCGSFLQNRVPNLDLFDTLWRIIENPRKAFRIIMLAEHKNYALFLYALCGISVAFFGFWYFRIGNRFENMLFLIFWALLIGVPLGIALCPIVSSFHWALSKLLGGKATFRTSMGITSYALMPFTVSLLLLLPIELMTFGMYLFTFNPHPIAIKPISYIVLIGLNVIMILWAFILLIVGTNVGNQITLWKSVIVVAILYVLVLQSIMFCGEYTINLF
jgi:hypothetical protein